MTARPSIDLASPEETAARLTRMAAAEHRKNTRLADMCAARELRRKNEILTAWELLTELNSLMGAMRCAGGSDMERYRTALAEVASDLEDDLMGANESAAPARLHVVEVAHV